jgi:hypothetical protein
MPHIDVDVMSLTPCPWLTQRYKRLQYAAMEWFQ